jgi:hypothetical protein
LAALHHTAADRAKRRLTDGLRGVCHDCQQSQQIRQQGGVIGGLLNAVLGHSGGNFDLSSLGGLLGGLTRR